MCIAESAVGSVPLGLPETSVLGTRSLVVSATLLMAGPVGSLRRPLRTGMEAEDNGSHHSSNPQYAFSRD